MNKQRFCIFCGGSSLSKEHIFPNWMGKYLPDWTTGTDHQISATFQEGSHTLEDIAWPLYKTGRLHRVGDHRSRKLRVVCITCNSGWMSELQVKARPALTRLILGGWQRATPVDLSLLSAWAAMFTMVWEFADERTAAASSDDRSFLREHMRAPPNWSVWIGRFSGLQYSGATRHTAWLLKHASSAAAEGGERCNMQLTISAVGQLFFQTFSSSVPLSDAVISALKLSALSHGLRRISPNNSRALMHRSPPKIAITDQTFRSVIDQTALRVADVIVQQPKRVPTIAIPQHRRG